MSSTLTYAGSEIVNGALVLNFTASDTAGHEDRKMYVDAYSSLDPDYPTPGTPPATPQSHPAYWGYSNSNPPVKKNEVTASFSPAANDLYECKAYLYEGSQSLVPDSNIIMFHVTGGVVVID